MGVEDGNGRTDEGGEVEVVVVCHGGVVERVGCCWVACGV